MTQETGENPKGPKTDFSFFPVQEEKDFVASASAETMIDAIKEQPDFCVQYLHELWRTNRDDDIYKCFKSGEVLRQMVKNLHYSGFSTDIAFINIKFDEPIEKCEEFLLETVSIFLKANNSIPRDDRLGLESQMAVDLTVGGIMREVAVFKERYQTKIAGLN